MTHHNLPNTGNRSATWNMEFLFEGHLDDVLRQEYLTRGDGVILYPVETLLPGIFLAECQLERDAE